MERLTYVAENGEVLFHPADLPDDEGITITQLAKDGRYKALEEIAERLANREQAEEQGLLLRLLAPLNGVESFSLDGKTTWYRLPCRIGDTVYQITKDFISEYQITSMTIYPYSIQFNWECTKGVYKNVVGFAGFEIGKTVFLTREEAEAKLKEMKENNEK